MLQTKSLRGKRWKLQPLFVVYISLRKNPSGCGHDPWQVCGTCVEYPYIHTKKAAGIVKKALESAIANAEHNDGADIDELKVTTIYVDKAQSMKRFSARAKGRGNRIEKQTCHIVVKVGA